MSIELRKYHLIEEIVAMDEVLLSKYEELMNQTKIEVYEISMKSTSAGEYRKQTLDVEKDVKVEK